MKIVQKITRKINKFRRSIKAISPIISVLLLIAIAVVASLVVYAWVMGYIGGATTKAGLAINIQSLSSNQASGTLTIYVQNTGMGAVQLNQDSAVYINNTLVAINSVSPAGDLVNGIVTIPQGQTVGLVVSWPYSGPVTIKVVTTTGAFMTTTGTVTAGGVTYQVTFGTSGSGTTSPSGTNSYTDGQEVGISATPGSGYTFSDWTYTGSVTIADLSLASTTATVNGAGTVTANFAQTNYQVAFSTSPSGAGSTTPSGTQTYLAGSSGNTISANANTGYQFSDWTYSGSITIADATSASTTATINGGGSITANFVETVSSIVITPAASTVAVGGSQSYVATAYDASGGILGGVTSSTAWSIDSGAGGSWVQSTGTYTSANTGTWTVTGTYDGFTSTAQLSVYGSLSSFAISYIGPETAGASFAVTITAVDGSGGVGNTVANFAGSASLTDLSSSISPTSATFTAGVWTGQVTITKTVPTNIDVITATDSSDSSVQGVSIPFIVTPGALATFVFSSISSPQIAGTSFSVTILAQDANGNNITTYTGPATLTDTSGSISPTTATFTAGVWTGQVTITKTQVNDVITATDSSVTPSATGKSGQFTVKPGALTSFYFANIGQQTAGQAFGITVAAVDAYNNTITTYSGSVGFGDLSGSGSLVLVTSGTFINGVYTGTVEIKAAYVNDIITATDSSTLVTGASNDFTIIAGAATQLVYTVGASQTLPINTVSSVITVSLEDANGNPVNALTAVTVTLSSSYPTTATFYNSAGTAITTTPITITIPAGSSSANFYFSDTQYESPVITASATLASGLTSVTTTFTVTQYQLIFVPSTASEPVGQGITEIQVERESVVGHHGYGGTGIEVQLSTSSATGYFATLSHGVYTPITEIAIATNSYYNANYFYYIDTTAGTATLTAATPGYTSGTATFTIYAASLAGFNVTASGGGNIGTQTTGTAFNIMITAVDQYGNAYTGYTGTNTLTVSASSGTISPSPTTAFAAGVLTVPVTISGTFTTPTTVSISTSESGASTVSGTSNTFTLYTPALTKFTFSTIDGTQQAGVTFRVTITAIDQEGHTFTGFSGSVALTETGSGAGGTVPQSPLTFANGVYTGSVSVTMIGTGVSITATYDGTSSASNTFTVTAGPLYQFVFSTISSPQTAGTTFSVTITAEDQYGNTVTSYGHSTALTETGGGAGGTVHSASVTFTNGVYTGNVYVTEAGTGVTITATYDGTSSASNTFTVTAGALNQFSFSTISSPQVSGTAFAVTITAEDQYGNTVTSFTGSETLVCSYGSATLTPTSVTFMAGVALNVPVTITVSSGQHSLYLYISGYQTEDESNQFTVYVPALSGFTFSNIATPQTSGNPFSVTITAIDQYGNTLTTYSGPITLEAHYSTNTGSSTLTTSTGSTSLTFASGVWTGQVTVTVSSSRTVYLYMNGYQTTADESNQFTV